MLVFKECFLVKTFWETKSKFSILNKKARKYNQAQKLQNNGLDEKRRTNNPKNSIPVPPIYIKMRRQNFMADNKRDSILICIWSK